MENGRDNTTGFVFGSFMIAAVVAALLPTRERQLYQYDCHESGGLVTQLVGFPTSERDGKRRIGADNRDPYELRECWPERGLVAGRILSPDDEFANTPTYSMVRTVGHAGNVVEALRRRPEAGGAARSLPPRTPPTAGEQAVALLPSEPAADAASIDATPPRLASLSASPSRAFPGGLATAPFGPIPGAGGGAPAITPPPATGGPGEQPGETPPISPPTGTPQPETPPPTGNPPPVTPPSTGNPPPVTPPPVTPPPTGTPPVTPPPTGNPPPVDPPVNPPLVDPPPVVGLVPEPATWLMLIMGFFAIGGAARSRMRARLATLRA